MSINITSIIGRSFMFRSIYHRVDSYDKERNIVRLLQIEPDWNGSLNKNKLELSFEEFEHHWYDDGTNL